MAISTIGTDIDPFAATPGPAPEDTRAPQPEVDVSQPAPLPEGAGTKIDTSA
jgi:hypothetical protein